MNISDGGYIENLDIYELLRRKCKYIVACDAAADADLWLNRTGIQHTLVSNNSHCSILEKNLCGKAFLFFMRCYFRTVMS